MQIDWNKLSDGECLIVAIREISKINKSDALDLDNVTIKYFYLQSIIWDSLFRKVLPDIIEFNERLTKLEEK